MRGERSCEAREAARGEKCQEKKARKRECRAYMIERR